MAILIENESQWRTEDLKEIVRRIEATPGFSRENFGQETLLLFTTSRKKVKKDKWGDSPDEIPEAADCPTHGRLGSRYEDTRVVIIRSAEALKADVLDRLANSDVQQDMKPEDVLKVVKETAYAIGGWRGKECDFDWYTEVALRIGGPGKRSKVAAKREIRALRNDQFQIRYRAREAIEKIEKKIEKIREKFKLDD